MLTKKLTSELAASLKIYLQVLENVCVADKKTIQNDPAVQEAASKGAESLYDIGGVQSLSYVLWWKHRPMIPARNMLTKWST